MLSRSQKWPANLGAGKWLRPRVRVISDNPLYKPYEGSGEEVNVVGRIRWFAREM